MTTYLGFKFKEFSHNSNTPRATPMCITGVQMQQSAEKGKEQLCAPPMCRVRGRERVCMYDGKRDAGVGVGVGGWVLGWG